MMDHTNSVSPLPPPEAPLAMMEINEKTPPRTPISIIHDDMPPPPDEKPYNNTKSNCKSCCEYTIIVIFSTILLLCAPALTIFWIFTYRKGVSLTDPDLKFNLHPILMVIGFVTFTGFSILIFRLCRCMSHGSAKCIHIIIHVLTAGCVSGGLWFSYQYHVTKELPHLYSLHSWLALITVGLFILQFLIGFLTFVLMQCCHHLTSNYRKSVIPAHANIGLLTFVLGVATCVTGLTEKAMTSLGDTYKDMTLEGLIINGIGAMLVILSIIISFAVRRSQATPDTVYALNDNTTE